MLAMYTIYNSPADFPGKIVLRKWLTAGREPIPTDEVAVCDTIEEAREFLPPGLVCLFRSPEDDPCIMETWL